MAGETEKGRNFIKKLVSLALILALCLGLAVPAAAASGRTFTVHAEEKTGTVSALGAKSFQVRNWKFDRDEATGLASVTKSAAETLALSQVLALTPGSEIVIESSDGYVPDDLAACQAWSDPDGDGVYEGRITRADYHEDADSSQADTELLEPGAAGPFAETEEEDAGELQAVYYAADWPVSCAGTIYYYTLGFGAGLEGATARISTDYLLREFGDNTLFCLKFDDDGDYYFLLTAEEATDPATALEPIPASGTAAASTQVVTVDGKQVEFQMYALLDGAGNPTNYVKLRDLAYVLSGTKAQFEVGWNGAVQMETGKAYTPNGSEMKTPFSGDRAYKGGAQTVEIDGMRVALTAITLTDDQGGGYNYFKLRDLGQALGFNVRWDGGVIVESEKPYTG